MFSNLHWLIQKLTEFYKLQKRFSFNFQQVIFNKLLVNFCNISKWASSSHFHTLNFFIVYSANLSLNRLSFFTFPFRWQHSGNITKKHFFRLQKYLPLCFMHQFSDVFTVKKVIFTFLADIYCSNVFFFLRYLKLSFCQMSQSIVSFVFVT